jgi:hypothetical protein
MPGARRLHQESATSSKGETIFGHMFGAVGVLAGAVGHCCCVPMKASLHDGMRAAGWNGARAAGISAESHVAQSVRCTFEAARALGSLRRPRCWSCWSCWSCCWASEATTS